MTSSVRKTIRVVAAVVECDGKYLVTQRRPEAVLPLLWEFPGGRVEDGEGDASALQRELLHRIGAEANVGEMISYVSHPYARYTVDLYLYACELIEGTPVEPRNVNDVRWVLSDDFESLPFTPADEASMSQLLGEPSA